MPIYIVNLFSGWKMLNSNNFLLLNQMGNGLNCFSCVKRKRKLVLTKISEANTTFSDQYLIRIGFIHTFPRNSPFNWRSSWINVDSPFNTSWFLFRFNLSSKEHKERICYWEGWTVYDPGRIMQTLDCHVIHTRDFHVIHTKIIWSRNSHWNKTSVQTFHKITYNTIILTRCVITFLDFNCLYITKVLSFLDYILISNV